MSDRVKENVIEWIEGDKVASFTFSQKKFINRVRKLAEKYGDDVRILRENADGSIFGHNFPVWSPSSVSDPKYSGHEGVLRKEG